MDKGDEGDKVVLGDLTLREALVIAFAAAGCTSHEAVSEANKAIGLMTLRAGKKKLGVVNVCKHEIPRAANDW